MNNTIDLLVISNVEFGHSDGSMSYYSLAPKEMMYRMPEPQRICNCYFRRAEKSLKTYIDWRTFEWIASIKKELPWLPNMQGQMDIITDDISLLERFFLPIKKILRESL